MESSPIVRFDSTTVQTPPVHALLQSAHFGSSLHATLRSFSQVPLTDQCIGCFAQYNCQTVLRLPVEEARSYRAVSNQYSKERGSEGSEPLGEPLVLLSLFLGLQRTDLETTSDAMDTQHGPASLGKIVIMPFEWPHQSTIFGCPDDKQQSTGSKPRVMNYSARIDLSWKTTTECQINIAFKPNALSCSAESFFHNLIAVLNALDPSSSLTAESDSSTSIPAHEFRLDSTARRRLKAAVESIQAHMARGDCYLANLTERIEVNNTLRAHTLSQFLERWGRQPSRFGWFLQSTDCGIECYSPERFFRVKGTELLTEPIKGTTPCLTNGASDQRRAAQRLWQSQKERCEQHLVTDLLRNDFAPVCVPGSIAVTSPLEIRFCSGLAQMTSVVCGQLRSGVGAGEILRAVLPAGSVTGAPKKAACQILQQLEPAPRGLYCGVIADVRAPDEIEATLLIRSLFTEGFSTYACAGAGITTLSIADDEVDEIETKLRSFLSRCSQ